MNSWTSDLRELCKTIDIGNSVSEGSKERKLDDIIYSVFKTSDIVGKISS